MGVVPTKPRKLDSSLKLKPIPKSVFKAVATVITEELEARFQKQTGQDGVKFPKKKRPDLSGSPLFLEDTGVSRKPVITYTEDSVIVRPTRPIILSYHDSKAPLYHIDDKFKAKVSKRLATVLRPIIRKLVKK